MEKRIDKATERAYEAYPKETRDIDGIVVDIGHPQYMRNLYIEGYKQAEKDLELGWEDLKLLQDISHEVIAEVARGSVDYYQIYPTQQSFLEEVLKRFKERKEK